MLPQAELVELLKTHVLPGIDEASFKLVLQQALQQFRVRQESVELINSEKHHQSINEMAKKLKRAGYNKRHEYMEGTTDEMETWLNNLFQVGIERGLELDTIQKCLIFMEGHILALINATQDPHYFDACFECHVYGPKFAIRYDGSPDYVLHNFWRDLLLIAIVQGDKVVLANFKATQG